MFMKHPDLPDNAPVETTQDAFDGAWKEAGWELCNPTDEEEVLDPEGAARAAAEGAGADQGQGSESGDASLQGSGGNQDPSPDQVESETGADGKKKK